MVRALTIPLLALALAACDSSGFGGGSGKKAAKKTEPSKSTATDGDEDEDEDDSGEESTSGAKTGTSGATDAGTDGDEAAIDISDGEVKCAAAKVTDGGKKLPGFGGKVYQLPEGTDKLPADYSKVKLVGQVNALKLDVPKHDWQQGFPGIPDLVEWFAIVFDSQLAIPEDGTYEFKTISDDGSKLYIDDQLVVDNDGKHAEREVVGAQKALQKGPHRMKVEWFQGPRYSIALQVYWRKSGDASFDVVPEDALSHVKDCELDDLGSFQ